MNLSKSMYKNPIFVINFKVITRFKNNNKNKDP